MLNLPGEKLNLSAPSLRSAVVKLSAEVGRDRALRRAKKGKAVLNLPGENLNLSATSLRSAVVKLSAEVGRDRLS